MHTTTGMLSTFTSGLVYAITVNLKKATCQSVKQTRNHAIVLNIKTFGFAKNVLMAQLAERGLKFSFLTEREDS